MGGTQGGRGDPAAMIQAETPPVSVLPSAPEITRLALMTLHQVLGHELPWPGRRLRV